MYVHDLLERTPSARCSIFRILEYLLRILQKVVDSSSKHSICDSAEVIGTSQCKQ